MMGRCERAAIAPAKCAAIPAAAMITFMPLSAALEANSSAICGVLCAEIILTTGWRLKAFSWSMQDCITGKSLSEPITTATLGD